jgi:hypothetical protein
MRFYLNFKSDSTGRNKLTSRFGVDGIKFSLKQKDRRGGMAGAVSFVVQRYTV